jgi:hypothetical protein
MGPLPGGEFEVVALEVLNAAAHVKSQIEHPLLIIALCSQFLDCHFFSLIASPANGPAINKKNESFSAKTEGDRLNGTATLLRDQRR